MLGRALQGMAIGAYQTAAYAYIPEYWPDEVDQRVCVMEISVAFGIGMGPIISSLIYETLGYIWIYVIPSAIIIITGTIVTVFILPAGPRLSNNSDGVQEVHRTEEEERETLGVIKSLFNKEMIYTFLSVVVTFTSFTLIMPMFELKILAMKEGPEIASIIFAFVQVGYGIGCGILLICTVHHRKGIFFIGIFFNMIGLWLLGADNFIHISRIYIMILMAVGLFIVGLTCSLTMIPNFSQNISILRKLYPNAHEELLVAMSSGFFTAAISLAEFQGPIVGGILSDLFGFSKGCLLFSLGVFSFFLLFTFHAKGYVEFYRLLMPEPKENASMIERECLLTQAEEEDGERDAVKGQKDNDLTSLNSPERMEQDIEVEIS